MFVTVVGWLILAKGVLLSLLTPQALIQLFERMHYGEHYYHSPRAHTSARLFLDLGRLHRAVAAEIA